ncbi:DNA-binding transcriptional regulator, AcrR family [Amycolatopsis xylanica]|uniref:DNA-binding transcriptional regulator, AcrR family n=1 Tax=Amycolatopsis xylanica TaxID=589385 RepID=A0A1H2T4S0_9PSEU|nr:TetR family transcriptional regulator [Amycolatopsis xylanica]SDW38715.1 DNA-binding transcriptional regulator, AcrR family [Amycolatopsis xylanica]
MSEGLRERKKVATRQALSWAALNLALERGLENVRVEDIAATAGVSERTFRNYFSSKYEALTARHFDRMVEAAAALLERPAGEPLWDSIEHVLAAIMGKQRERSTEVLASLRVVLAEPALQAEMIKATFAAENAFSKAVAARTGTDAGRDLYPRLVASAVGAAQHVATERWLHADPPIPLWPELREALRLLAAGLPEPRGTR